MPIKQLVLIFFTLNISTSTMAIQHANKLQIERIKDTAKTLANKNKPAFLILGSANFEITALKNQEQKDSWIFWHLSSNEGSGESHEDKNPYIDGDFNDFDLVEAVANALSGVFAKIVMPAQVVEYTQWNENYLQLFKKMLSPDGILVLPVSWSFPGGFQERLEDMNTTQADFFIDESDEIVIEDATNDYSRLLTLFSGQDKEEWEIAQDILYSDNFRNSVYANYLKGTFMSQMFEEETFTTPEKVKESIEKKILAQKQATAIHKLQISKLADLLKEIFTSVGYIDNPAEDLKDIPSTSQELGNKLLILK